MKPPLGMHCPACRKKMLRTLETRPSADNAIRRRKVCMKCGYRCTTVEKIRKEVPA